MNRDVIVIGASAGGLDVLLEAVAGLPADLPAAVFVALHTLPHGPGLLPDLLASRGPLPAQYPVHLQEIERGQIYVAPPDNHLVVRRGYVEVARGPRENGHRPAVDALFRSAARAYGPRVIGAVLSGHHACGTAGLLSIKARGGIAVVQAPETARVAEMPRSALENVAVDRVVAPADLARVLAAFAAEDAPGDARRAAAGEAAIEEVYDDHPTDLVCPACHGVLRETRAGSFEHFHCHVGHRFSIDTLVRAHDDDVERALWSAVRALEDGCSLNRRLAEREVSPDLRRRFAEKAHAFAEEADLIRGELLRGDAVTGPVAPDGPPFLRPRAAGAPASAAGAPPVRRAPAPGPRATRASTRAGRNRPPSRAGGPRARRSR